MVLHPEFVEGKYAFYTRPMDDFIETGSGGGIGFGLCEDILNPVIDEEKMTSYASSLERGEDIPPVKVFEHDGEFYIEDGQESALAYAFNLYTYLPTVIVKGEIGDRKYVKMKNSL